MQIFRYGLYGVLLFFIISGYCIAFSARSSRSAWDFYAKRLGRLLPALIVCAAITTAFKHLFPELVPPGRVVTWFHAGYTIFALPSLNVLRHPYMWPDGSYWSLAIEFQFYLLCFAIMAIGLRKYLLIGVCAWTVARLLLSDPSTPYSNDFFPFFIAGLSVAAYAEGEKGLAAFGLIVAAAVDAAHLLLGYSEPSAPIDLSRSIMLWAGTALMFAASAYKASSALRPIAFIGLVSYPMYLLHQDLGNMLLDWLNVPYTNGVVPILLRLVVLPALVVLSGAAIFYGCERPLIGPVTRLLRSSLLGKTVDAPEATAGRTG
jgi:peptidoglycan/LPS O-acetylase OafA/YrhL